MKPWPWLGDERATNARRSELKRLLGPLPTLDELPSGEQIGAQDLGFAHLERWRLTLNNQELVPALLLLPPNLAPRGLVLYGHAHGNRFDVGKDELLQGRPALQRPPYGEVLPALGWAVLAIDHWCFGDRAHHAERALVKRLLWQGETLWGWRVHDALASLDWLHAQARFEALPTVALGLSMGSTMAIWTAALDARIDACFEMCCLAEFDALLASGVHDLHGEYFFVPGLAREFGAAEIAALIAPRLHISMVGQRDPLTPAAGVAAVDSALRSAYSELNAARAWQQHVEDVGHQETSAMRKLVVSALSALTHGG